MTRTKEYNAQHSTMTVQLTTKTKLRSVYWCWHIIKINISVGCCQCHFMNIWHSYSISDPHLNVTLGGSSFCFRGSLLHFNFTLKFQFCTPHPNDSFLQITLENDPVVIIIIKSLLYCQLLRREVRSPTVILTSTQFQPVKIQGWHGYWGSFFTIQCNKNINKNNESICKPTLLIVTYLIGLKSVRIFVVVSWILNKIAHVAWLVTSLKWKK